MRLTYAHGYSRLQRIHGLARLREVHKAGHRSPQGAAELWLVTSLSKVRRYRRAHLRALNEPIRRAAIKKNVDRKKKATKKLRLRVAGIA